MEVGLMKSKPQLLTPINTPDESSPWVPRLEKLFQKIENSKSRISLAGGVYKPKGRHTWRVWFPWKGKKILVNQYLDGTPNYCREQAERVLEKIRAEVDQGKFDPALWGKDRILQVEKAWDVYQQQCPCGKDRMEARERIFNDFILPYFKDKSMKEIEEHHIMEWWTTVSKTYASSYLRVIRATLRAFITFHRVTRIKMFKFPVVKVPKKTPSWLSKGEQEKILEFVPSHHQPIIRFLMAYGCRVSEACNLKKGDIDWEKSSITFRERKNDKENTLEIFDEVRPFLKGSRKVTHLDLVFCTASGERYTRQVLYRLWIDASKAANQKYGTKIIPLKNATRHSLACQLLERGESMAMIARILGNTPSIVEKSYGAISVQAAGEALRKVYNG
jgi:integrase/recombinase XerD